VWRELGETLWFPVTHRRSHPAGPSGSLPVAARFKPDLRGAQPLCLLPPSGDAAHTVVVCHIEAAIWAHSHASRRCTARCRPSAIHSARLPGCSSQSAHSALCADAADGVAAKVSHKEAPIWGCCQAARIAKARCRAPPICAAQLPCCPSHSAHSALWAQAADSVVVSVCNVEGAIRAQGQAMWGTEAR
jgi:hypothetical protein